MQDDQSDIPIPNAIVITLPAVHRAAAAKLRQQSPAVAENSRKPTSASRAAWRPCLSLNREAPPFVPE
jgi:hypothetical protein